MNIESFRPEDIASFLTLAAAENWVAGEWEFRFLLNRFPQGCFTARDESGVVMGHVSSLLHEKSGWIGNLVVAEQYRGKGLGSVLFTRALVALQMAGSRTIWLTASESGLPLYEKHGFTRIDTIYRWSGSGRLQDGADPGAVWSKELAASAHVLDGLAWGDRRKALLEATVKRGGMLQYEDGFAVLQPCKDSVQCGPFTATNSGSAEQLFTEVINRVPHETKILVDTPASNRAALRLLTHGNMVIAGSSRLMCAGSRPKYRPELLYGLATMGSCG